MRSSAETGNGRESVRPLSEGSDSYSRRNAESFRHGAKQLPAPKSTVRPSVGDEGGVGQESPSYFLKSSLRASVLEFTFLRNRDLALVPAVRLGSERRRKSG